ncbi:MAG: hypothetical protein KAU62_09890 [Candidatus Heimdallarchaeota archaeon]|nr:hypothetical protein [Candidatus Heimdallarchaeota archaeon]MCG3256387.1 hypothetical protein [Candidatus Heimdallarchaeota archaeon]MCK4611453.1 hypothetical protein [Candidatus Heimdallarchaeota archaeon]
MFGCKINRIKAVNLLLFLLIITTTVKSKASSDLDGALKLTITSISWEMATQTENYTSFDMFFNLTIDNVSSKKIETAFADSCKFDSYINYQLNDSSLLLTTHGNEACLMMIIELELPPGSSYLMDYEHIKINDTSFTDLPDGYYEVVIGEEYVKSNPYFEKEARAYFQVFNSSYSYNLPERPTYEVPVNNPSILSSIILFSILLQIHRKKRKQF